MNKHLLTVLEYFLFFSYTPTLDEIYTFFPRKISKKNLRILLKREVITKHVLRLPNNMHYSSFPGSSSNYSLVARHSRYTLPQYSTSQGKIYNLKFEFFNKKHIAIVQKYILLLSKLSCVRFVGITGTSAMVGKRLNDDLDLCIVTKHNLLWTTRFVAVIIAKILRIHSKTGVCLNLFFDETGLTIPYQKQNSYIAHELLQMKPLMDKGGIYEQFLTVNEWIYRYFPNAHRAKSLRLNTEKLHKLHVMYYMLYKVVDHLFKSLQLPHIIRNRTAYAITPTQLWLFKSDFEKKLKRRGLVI